MTHPMPTYELSVTNHCRGCGSAELEPRFSLGNQYLSDFHSDPTYRPGSALLGLLQCERCGLVQLSVKVGREAMYHDRYGYRSGVNAGIRANLQAIVDQGMLCRPDAQSWLDVGSNDGTLLSYVPKDIIRVGVDPVAAFAPEARAHANVIVSAYFAPNLFRGEERFDVITSISMFYDVPDATRFALGVAQVLDHGGVWIIQQNYLGDMLKTGAFDNICHEHLTYFDLRALEAVLERVGLQVVSVVLGPINGGCFRTVVARRGEYPVQQSVLDLREWEARNLRGNDIWEVFRVQTSVAIGAVQTSVAAIRKMGGEVMIYGASTRGSVIWQAAGLNDTNVVAAVEAQEAKIGRYYSALGAVPIISEQEARDRNPALMLVGPYWHKELFLAREQEYIKRGGILAFPLPQFELHSSFGREATV